MWKGLFREVSLFVLDTGIVYLSVLLFSIHLSLFLFIPFFPGARYSHPPLIFCVALVLLYKLVHEVLRRRGHPRAAARLSAGFLGFFSLWAAGSLVLTGRLVLFEIAFPKILAVFAVLTALAAACFLFRWWRWRTVPLFLVLVLSFNFLILRISRYTFEERDLLPLPLAGVKEIRKIDNPDPPDPAGVPAGMNGRILGALNSFAGFLLASHQFGYVYAPPQGGFLYVSDFSIRTELTNIYKIRLDDLSTAATIRSEGYFRDMILARDGKEFLATNCIRQEVCYYGSDHLEPITCVGLNVPSVLNLLELPEGGVVVTSEHGFVTFVGPDRKIRRQFRPPIFCEEVALDRTGRRLLIASMGGYTLGELDAREMKMTRKKFPSISSCGIAWDLGRNRVFLPRLLQGDLVVLDGDSLERVARIPLAPGLRDVLYIPERDLVVAGNYFNGNLSILEGSTYRVLRTFWVGSKNRSLSYSPERDRLYVQTVNRILEIDLDQALSAPVEQP
jgi:hypothetical protein